MELFVFSFSHYCEKALWAAHFKGLKPRVRYLLPGLHGSQIRKITGQTQVPVLRDKGQTVVGSTPILRYFDECSDSGSLFLRESGKSDEVERVVEDFDALGPAIRAELFAHILKEPRLAAGFFLTQHKFSRLFYPSLMALVGSKLKAEVTADREMIARGLEETCGKLDWIEQRQKESGYLVGDSFSAADLTAASMLFPCCYPRELGFQIPPKLGEAMRPWFERWQGHQALDWVRAMYARHRFQNGDAIGAVGS